MKCVVIIDLKDIDELNEMFPHSLIYPLTRSMYIDCDESTGVYLTQPYIESFYKTAHDIMMKKIMSQFPNGFYDLVHDQEKKEE